MKIQRMLTGTPYSRGHYPPWNCFMCGDCCKNISISQSEHNLIMKKIGSKAQRRYKKNVIVHPHNKKFFLIQNKCPLQLPNGRCGIYPIRPFACRLFICGRVDASIPLVYADDKCKNHVIRRSRDPIFAILARNSEEVANQWGTQHGWTKTKLSRMQRRAMRKRIN